VRSGAHVDPLTRHSPALRSTGKINRIFSCIDFRFASVTSVILVSVERNLVCSLRNVVCS